MEHVLLNMMDDIIQGNTVRLLNGPEVKHPVLVYELTYIICICTSINDDRKK